MKKNSICDDCYILIYEKNINNNKRIFNGFDNNDNENNLNNNINDNLNDNNNNLNNNFDYNNKKFNSFNSYNEYNSFDNKFRTFNNNDSNLNKFNNNLNNKEFFQQNRERYFKIYSDSNLNKDLKDSFIDFNKNNFSNRNIYNNNNNENNIDKYKNDNLNNNNKSINSENFNQNEKSFSSIKKKRLKHSISQDIINSLKNKNLNEILNSNNNNYYNNYNINKEIKIYCTCDNLFKINSLLENNYFDCKNCNNNFVINKKNCKCGKKILSKYKYEKLICNYCDKYVNINNKKCDCELYLYKNENDKFCPNCNNILDNNINNENNIQFNKKKKKNDYYNNKSKNNNYNNNNQNYNSYNNNNINYYSENNEFNNDLTNIKIFCTCKTKMENIIKNNIKTNKFECFNCSKIISINSNNFLFPKPNLKNNIFCSNCKKEEKNYKIICFCGNQLIEMNNKFPCNLCNRIYFITLIKCSCFKKNIFDLNFVKFEISNSNDFVTSIAYKHPNNFLTGHESGKIFYFEIKSRKILNVFKDHNKKIFDIKIINNNKHFISVSDDKKIIIKDFENTIFSYKNDFEFECVDFMENFILICDKKNKVIFIKFENEKFFVKKIEIYSKFLIFLNKIDYGIFFVDYYNNKLELFEIQNEKFNFVKKFNNNFNIQFIKEFSIGKFFTFSNNNNNNYNLNLWKISENNFINEFIFYQKFFDLFFLFDYFNINNFLVVKENNFEIFENDLKNKIDEFDSNQNRKILILKDNFYYNLAGIKEGKNNIVYFYNINFFDN